MNSNKKIIIFCSVVFIVLCACLVIKGVEQEKDTTDMSTQVVSDDTNVIASNMAVTASAVSGASVQDGQAKKKKTVDKETTEKENKVKSKEKNKNKEKSSDKKKVESTKRPSATVSPKTAAIKSTQTPAAKPAEQPTEKPTDKPQATEPQSECSLLVTCAEVFSHKDKLKDSAKKVIPDDGIILQVKSAFQPGETVFEYLKRVCSEKGILLDYSFTAIYSTYYIKGINNLYEFDCGDESGWIYTVNGVSPSYGCSQYKIQNGDKIVFNFTCER